jgi:hypothetical protein
MVIAISKICKWTMYWFMHIGLNYKKVPYWMKVSYRDSLFGDAIIIINPVVLREIRIF